MTQRNLTPIPEGMHNVTPHLVCKGASDAIEFYKRAFGAAEAIRLPGPDGKLMHAMIRIGDSPVMLVEPPRVYRRLHFLRGWNDEQANEIFPGIAGTGGATGI